MPPPQKTLTDYLVIAITPALIMTLIGSLTFFLITVFYDGPFEGRLHFICAMFIMATVYRFEREPYTWQASSSQMMRKGHFSWASNVFHIGILSIGGGHVVGLLVPAELFHLIGMPDNAHQMMELVAGSIFGFATQSQKTVFVDNISITSND